MNTRTLAQVVSALLSQHYADTEQMKCITDAFPAGEGEIAVTFLEKTGKTVQADSFLLEVRHVDTGEK